MLLWRSHIILKGEEFGRGTNLNASAPSPAGYRLKQGGNRKQSDTLVKPCKYFLKILAISFNFTMIQSFLNYYLCFTGAASTMQR